MPTAIGLVYDNYNALVFADRSGLAPGRGIAAGDRTRPHGHQIGRGGHKTGRVRRGMLRREPGKIVLGRVDEGVESMRDANAFAQLVSALVNGCTDACVNPRCK